MHNDDILAAMHEAAALLAQTEDLIDDTDAQIAEGQRVRAALLNVRDHLERLLTDNAHAWNR